MGCIRNLRRNRCVQVIVFIIITSIDTADMVSDWLFYNDMRLQEKGLVFGPIDSRLLYAILAFSITGTITFIVELIFFSREIFRPDSESWVNIDYISTITIWVEEIPQITISAIIAGCREEAVSIYQISKASIVIFGSIVRLLAAVIRYCIRKRQLIYGKNKTYKYCTGVMHLGLVLSIIGSSLVFAFSHVLRDGDKITFLEPTEFYKMRRDTTKYYTNVGVFLNTYALQNKSDNSEWIKLFDLIEIEKNKFPAQKIRFNSNNDTKIQIQTIGNRITCPLLVQKVECYRNNQWNVSQTNQCLNLFETNETTSEIVIYFNFIPQSSQYFMGDIQFNSLHTSLGKCSNNPGNYTSLDLKYFKAKNLEDTLSKFYKSEDLIPIEEVWKTGVIGCPSSGSRGPNLANSIHVECLNI